MSEEPINGWHPPEDAPEWVLEAWRAEAAKMSPPKRLPIVGVTHTLPDMTPEWHATIGPRVAALREQTDAGLEAAYERWAQEHPET